MTDRPPDDPSGPAAPSGDAPEGPGDAGVDAAGRRVERRAFLRQLTGDAVVATGRLAGLSTALRRSVVAAGVAAVGDGEAPGDDAPPDPVQVPVPAAPEPPGAIEPTVLPAVGAAPPEPAVAPVPDPASLLSPHQHEMLEHGTTAILGVNDGSGAPHLTSSTFHWDRTVLRLPSELFVARVARIDADPNVSVLVELGAEAWVAVTGIAEIISGDGVEAEMLTILRKGLTDDDAARQWSAMRSTGDRVVIRIRPTRFVWRLG